MWAIADRRRRDQRPVARRKRLVALLPPKLCRSLRAGVTELQRNLGVRFSVNVIDNARPRRAMLVVVHAGAAGTDARVRRRTDHLGEHQPGATMRAASQMHEVIVVGRAVDARVLRHRRDDDAIRYRHAAKRERREHRRYRRVVLVRPRGRAPRVPRLHRFDERAIAQP